jgi:hypothetical protein
VHVPTEQRVDRVLETVHPGSDDPGPMQVVISGGSDAACAPEFAVRQALVPQRLAFRTWQQIVTHERIVSSNLGARRPNHPYRADRGMSGRVSPD